MRNPWLRQWDLNEGVWLVLVYVRKGRAGDGGLFGDWVLDERVRGVCVWVSWMGGSRTVEERWHLRWKRPGMLRCAGHIVGMRDRELEEMNLGYEGYADLGIHAERLREAQEVRSTKQKLHLPSERATERLSSPSNIETPSYLLRECYTVCRSSTPVPACVLKRLRGQGWSLGFASWPRCQYSECLGASALLSSLQSMLACKFITLWVMATS